MRIDVTPQEVLGLARAGGADVPPVITSVTGDGDSVRVSADLRRLDELPGPLRLAVRLAPIVRAQIRVVGFADGRATLAVEANAGGLPAHRLLGLLAEPIERALTAQGVPPGAVDVRGDASVVVDIDALLAAKLPGLTVTGLRMEDGHVHVEASV